MARPSLDTEDVFAFFQEQQDPARPLTVTDILTEFDWSRRTVFNKLQELVDRGDLATRKVGGNTRVWWRPASEIGIEGLEEAQKELKVPETPYEILQYARQFIPGENEEKITNRAHIILEAYEFLQERGKAQPRDIKEAVSHHDDGLNETSRWEHYLRPSLKTLPGIEPPPHGKGKWVFVEPGGEIDRALDVVIEASVQKLNINGEGVGADRRRALVQLAYNYLKRHGKAEKSHIQDHLPDYTANYTDFNQLWDQLLVDHLKELPGVEPGPMGVNIWHYIRPGGHLDQQLDVELDDWVQELDMVNIESVAERRRAMIQLAYEYVKEHGSAKSSDMKDALPDYSGHYRDKSSLWNHCIRPALEEAPDIEREGKGFETQVELADFSDED